MEGKDYKLLEKENSRLNDRIKYLENLLKTNNIDYDQEIKLNNEESIKKEIITPMHAIEFYRVFKRRKDVYSKRSISKDGKVGYFP